MNHQQNNHLTYIKETLNSLVGNTTIVMMQALKLAGQ
jgi:hypothetical protein